MPLFGPPNIKKLKAQRDLTGLVKALRHQAPSVRAAAAEALGEFGESAAVESLVPLLGDPDVAVSRTAATALGRLGWEPPNEEGRVALLVARADVEGLAGMGSSAVPLLIHALEARGRADEWIGASPLMLNEGVYLAWRGPLRLEDDGLTLTALDEVAVWNPAVTVRPGEDRGWRVRIDVPEDELDPRWTLVRALKDIGGPAVDLLVEAMDHENVVAKAHASWALVEIGEPALGPLISRYLPMFSDGSFHTIVVATIGTIAKASRETGGPGLVGSLSDYKGDESFTLNLGVLGRVALLAEESPEFESWVASLSDTPRVVRTTETRGSSQAPH